MKTKKSLICIITGVVLILAFFLCSCATATANSTQNTAQDTDLPSRNNPFKLELVGKSSDEYTTFYFYRDVVTDVIYIAQREKAYNAGMGGLTVMVDPETGLPMTAARYVDLYNSKAEISEE